MRNKIFILINLLFLISFVSAIPSPPVRFWGFGNIVIGDLVEVYDNDGILCGQSIVEHEGRYSLDCSGDDPATSEDEGANEGEIIIFKINGKTVETSENAIWNSGEFKQIDLILGILEDENPADNETAEETENETIGEDETTTEENNQPESGGNSGNLGGNSQTSENENPITGSVIDNQDTKKYKSEKESESENLIQDANSAPETSKITGGVIGTGKKIVNGGLYFIGILLIGFIALKLFIKVKRNSQPKKIKIIKYSDLVKQKRNREGIKFVFIILSGILLSINFVSAAQPPDCQMYSDVGGVIINAWNGNQDLAPIGAIITAYDADGTLSGNFTITTAGQFSMGIHGDDPGTGEDEGAEDGDIITFYIDGDIATVYGDATWNSAEFHKVNLTTTNDAPEIDSMFGPSGTVLGGSFQTVSVTSHDDDHSLGTADKVKIYVCKTNSASDYAGCVIGQEYCSSGLTTDDPSCSFNVETDDTTHNYYVFVMDEHGRISGSTTAFLGSYTTDSTAPTITSIVPANNSWTNDPTPSIIVNTNENSECKYSNVPGTAYTSKTSMSGTGTSHTATFPDMGADGTHYFYFQCNDTVGNLMLLATEYNYTIKLDTEIPTITDDYAYDDIWINVSSGDIIFTLNDTGGSGLRTDPAAMMYCTGIGCTPDTNLSSPYQINFTLEQDRVIRYQAYDVAGSGSIIGSFIVKIDKSAPNTTNDYLYDDVWNNEDASITILPFDPLASNPPVNGSGVNWTKYCNDTNGTCIPNTIYAGGTINFTDEGISYLRYYSVDNLAHNQSIQTVIIKIDKQNVSIANASISIENGSIYATNTTLNFNYSGFKDQAELSGIAGYYYSFINNEGTSSGTWDTDLNGILSGASQGNVTVFVWAKDNAGNIGLAVNDSIIVDSIAPSFTNWDNTKIIMSDTIPMTINFTIIEETSGISGVPTIRYKYGDGAWSNWTNTSLITGKNYTFNIPNPTWYNYYNKNIYWQVNAVDIAGNSANSSIQSYLIGSGESDPIVIRKNIEYQNQTDFQITYLITDEIYNTLNNTDITGVIYIDNDINTTQETFDLIEGEIKTRQKYLTISKDASNKNHTFATAFAVWNGNTFISNTPSISIPGYGGPFDIEIDAPATASPSTTITANINLINMNQDISKDVVVDYWITDTNNNTISGPAQKTVLANALENTSTIGSLTSPSSSGTYRFWARVTWVTGMSAEAFDSFTVATSSTGDTGDTGGSSSGGGGTTTPSITGKAIEEAPKELLDIRFKLEETIIYDSKDLTAEIKFRNFGTESAVVNLTYIILDNKKIQVHKESAELIVYTEKAIIKEFDDLELDYGEYNFILQVNYANTTETFEQDFEIIEEGFFNLSPGECYIIFHWFKCWYLIIIIIIIIILLWEKRKKRKKKKVKAKRKRGFEFKLGPLEIKFKFVLLILSGIVLIGILGIAGKSITGFAVNNFNVFIIGILGLLIFISRKKIAVVAEKTKEKIKKKHPKNSLKGLIKKKVYTDEGDYIGKVQEAILGKNKIDSLRIKLNKKLKKKVKGIVVKYKDVRNVRHVVIVDEKVMEKIKN